LQASGSALAGAGEALVHHTLAWPDGHGLGGLARHMGLDRIQRIHPVWIDRARHIEVVVTVDLPEGWTVDHPQPGARNLSAEQLTVSQTIEETERSVRRTIVVDVAAGRVSPTDWPTFRNVLATALRFQAEPLVIIPD